MFSGRMYSGTINNVNVGATQSIFTIYANSSKMLALRSISLGQSTQSTQANLRIRIRYLPGTITQGSGGGNANVGAWVSGDPVSASNVRINDTTPVTTSGTAVDLWDDTWNVINGWTWQPPVFVEPPMCGTNEAIDLILDTAPGSNILVNGTLVFEEVT